MRPNAAETEELLLNARESDRNAVDRLMERHRQWLERMVHGRRHRAPSQMEPSRYRDYRGKAIYLFKPSR